MNITDMNTKELFYNPPGIFGRKVYKSELTDIVHLTIEPGQTLPAHVTPVDVLFYVLEGTGICEIGPERETVTKDFAIESPKGVPHAWHNQSDRKLMVLVMKLPEFR